MNNIKDRPVGNPSGQVIVLRVSQSRRALDAYSHPRGKSKREVDRVMILRGYIRCGRRAA